MQAVFIDQVERIVKSLRKSVLQKDQGWYSELEMKTECKWTQRFGRLHVFLST